MSDGLPRMEKRRVRLADGRALIFYMFPPPPPSASPPEPAIPTPAPPPEDV
jgi:hypothetical protein